MFFKTEAGIEIPSDFRYKCSNSIFYRYGEFFKDDNFNDKRNKTIPKGVTVPVDDFYIARYNEIPKEYVILGILKKTGSGGIYKALNLKSKNIVILKEAQFLGDIDLNKEDSLDRAFREKQILTLIEREKFAPKLFSCFYLKNHFFLEIEYFTGTSLYQYLKEEKTDKWILQLVSIIRCLNEEYGIEYRDLSFDNIIVDAKGTLKLIDYGHSLIIDQVRDNPSLFGTPGFYETNLELHSNQPDDIYGIASMIYWMENLEQYSSAVKLNDKESIKNFEGVFHKQWPSNQDSKYNNILTKAFTHEFHDFSEFEEMLVAII